MDELDLLLLAIDTLRDELPALVGAAWEEVQAQVSVIEAAAAGLPSNPPALYEQLLSLFAKYPAAQTRLLERMEQLRQQSLESLESFIGEVVTAETSEMAQELIRYTDIACPRRVWAGAARIPVVVRLTMKPADQSVAVEALSLRPELPLLVHIEAPLFEVLNTHTQPIILPLDQDSAPVVFDLHPLHPGYTQVTLDFFQNNQPLRTVSIDVEITPFAVADGIEPRPAQALRVEEDVEPPDMVMHIAWNETSKQLQITLIRQGGAWWRTFPPVTVNGDPAAFTTQLYRQIVTSNQLGRKLIPGGNEETLSAADAKRRIKKLGQNLWEELVPADLKQLYAQEREVWRDASLLILSDEPHLPWELIWPYDHEAGVWEEEGPWCTSLALTRWLRKDERGNGNEMAPVWLDVESVAVFVPRYAQLGNLPFAQQEEQTLVGLMQRHQLRRTGPETPSWSNVMDFLEGGDYQWVHFAAHGSFFPDAPDGDSSLWLQADHALSPQDLTGAAIRSHFRQKHPAFFFNACEVGRQGYALTRISGWANRLVSAGAGLFVGPLWAVQDRSAAAFAAEFYQALLGGQTVAQAVRQARKATQEFDDPTWLAYSVYGHPNARLRPARPV